MKKMTQLKRYWQYTTYTEKSKLIKLLQKSGLEEDRYKKICNGKRIFSLKYWRIIISNSSLTLNDLYVDWEQKHKRKS